MVSINGGSPKAGLEWTISMDDSGLPPILGNFPIGSLHLQCSNEIHDDSHVLGEILPDLGGSFRHLNLAGSP